MTQKRAVTFRQQTKGSITEFIEDEGLVCQESQNLLSALAGALLSYRHEGAELSPVVLFCTDAGKVFKSFPGTVKYEIGRVPLGAPAVDSVLKDCAPLAARSWSIFIEKTANSLARYGVFSYIRTPTALPLPEAVGMVTDATCVLLRRSSMSSIELRGSKGNELSLNFSTTREEQVVPAESPAELFALDCCRGLGASANATDFRSYFKRMLADCISTCHGTILACAPDTDLKGLNEFRDGIVIDPGLDFFGAYDAYRSDQSAESILTMQSAEELLGGILRSDGIVVFDTRARLLAYRVFFGAARVAGPAAGALVGGARRRAFEGARAMVGPKLAALLFRSQDGLTIREGR
ncbi:MAG: hypothetical protein ACRD2E_01005 [Terriglobales bacterium]